MNVAVNQRMKSYMTAPTLYRTTVLYRDWSPIVKYAYAELNDALGAQRINVSLICRDMDLTEHELHDVFTEEVSAF